MNIINLSELDIDNTITPDHYLQQFTVLIRTMTPMSADTVKDQLQKKWEVVSCHKVKETIVI